MLKIEDHRRDSAGLKYVYPVVSRRAGGVSVGINLNVNNACNWSCVYCQVPGLTRGAPPPVDLALLESELRFFLRELIDGDYLIKNVPPEFRCLKDVAFSGNGEPTSASRFNDTVILVERILRELSLHDRLKIRLITNGSLMHRLSVQRGIGRIGALDGEIWFKVDRASEAGILRINGVKTSVSKIRKSLQTCAGLAPTWVQTCYFSIDGNEADEKEQASYLEFIESVRGKIKGVHLYGIARPSMQPEAKILSNVPPEKFHFLAKRISSLGIDVISSA